MLGSGVQIKAARSFLGWTQADLAREAGLTVNAIKWWEAYAGTTFNRRQARNTGLAVIAQAFEREGLTLSYDPPGVQVNARYCSYAVGVRRASRAD